MQVKIIGKLNNSRQRRCVYDKKGLCPSLVAGMGTGGNIPLVLVEKKDERGQKV